MKCRIHNFETSFAAGLAVIISVFFACFGIYIFVSNIRVISCAIMLVYFVGAFVIVFAARNIIKESFLYTCCICEDKIIVKLLGVTKYIFYYDKVIDAGIGMYAYNSTSGSTIRTPRYIYFSFYNLKSSDIKNINRLNISDSFFKVHYSKKIHDYLSIVLPKRLRQRIITS